MSAHTGDIDDTGELVGPDTLVLGIETSCDETAAALGDGRQ